MRNDQLVVIGENRWVFHDGQFFPLVGIGSTQAPRAASNRRRVAIGYGNDYYDNLEDRLRGFGLGERLPPDIPQNDSVHCALGIPFRFDPLLIRIAETLYGPT
jgi:hypothetical protein